MKYTFIASLLSLTILSCSEGVKENKYDIKDMETKDSIEVTVDTSSSSTENLTQPAATADEGGSKSIK